MITLILFDILILIIIWIALTYLEKKTIDKYKEIFDIACMLLIEPILFFFDISIFLCGTIAFSCIIYYIYSIKHPSRKLIRETFYLFSESYLFWSTPYAISKIFKLSQKQSDVTMVIISIAIILSYFIVLYLKKKNKDK